MAGVKQFQTYINSYLPSEYLGTPLVVDGYFGEATKRAATKLIQHRLNIEFYAGVVVDGYFGEASQAAFNLHVGSIKRYQTGFWVYMLQGLLYGNGYNPNGFDGSYGSGGGTGCLNAVNQYKADKNITEYPDTYWGEVGTETMASLCWKTYVEPLYFPIERGLENATYYIKNCYTDGFITAQLSQPQTVTFLNSDEYLKFKVIYNTTTGYYKLYNEYSGKYLAHTPYNTLVYTTSHMGSKNTLFTIERDDTISDTSCAYSIKARGNCVTYPSSTDFYSLTLKPSSVGTIFHWSFIKCDVRMPSSHFYTFDIDGDIDTTGPDTDFQNFCNNLNYLRHYSVNSLQPAAYSDLVNVDLYRGCFWLFSGHGNPGYIKFYDGIAITAYNISNLPRNHLAGLQCMLFLGCKTGLYDSENYSLVSSAVGNGAHFALGTTRQTYVSEDEKFIKYFLIRAAQQKTIDECIRYAIANSPHSYSDFYYLGDTHQILPLGK